MKILIALDDSTQSERALDFVTRVRWPAGSRVIVVSVFQPEAGALAGSHDHGAFPTDLIEAQRQRTHGIVSNAERILREAGLSVEGRIVEGDPRHALVESACGEHVDLVVMGSHGRTGVAKLMLGSVSSHLVTHSPCSVLVVKRQDNLTRKHAQRTARRSA